MNARYAACIALTTVCTLAACGTSDAPASAGIELPASGPSDEVVLPAAVIQRLGVRTAVAELAPLPDEVRGSAVVRFDESTIVDVYVPTGGWIERSLVRATGERVAQGSVLFELYSPTLVTTDTQYLASVQSGSDPTDNPYARGLLSLGLSEDMVAALRDKRRRIGRIPFRANADSVVTEVHFREGAFVVQGASVLRLAAADPFWVIADFPAAAAGVVRPDARVTVTSPASPGWHYDGTVAYVYPQLGDATRSVQARIVVPATAAPLLPGAYASVVLHASAEPVVRVPLDAVIRRERGDHVIVAAGDGRFAPRGVLLGRVSGDYAAVLEGLAAGDVVVTQALFLIDSEASLRASLVRMSSDLPPDVTSPDQRPHHVH